MKKVSLIAVFTTLAIASFAQIPEDVLKYSWQPTNGTARINAVGGAMGSLGGDITATFVNPAGLAFYKTTDIVLSPGYSFLKNKSNYRETSSTDKDNYFNLGATGIVSGWKGSGKITNRALSFAVTRTANFSNRIYYTGKNDFSSGAEQYAAEAANSGIHIDDLAGSNRLSFGTRMAAWNYLIDTASLPGHNGQDIISMAMYDALKNGGSFLVDQSSLTETSGGITEIALGYAANMADKFYFGGSIGLPIVKYGKTTTYREADATGNANNNFNFYELKENFETSGIGLNLKLGFIMKPTEYIRLGLAVHTPTWYSFEDSYSGSMSVNLDKYRTVPGTTTISAEALNGGPVPVYSYNLNTPWKFMVSGSYVLREIEDVRKQKGFITADVEYVTYKSNKFKSADETANDNSYYEGLNETMKSYYKNGVNFRVGGELKFTTLMTRLGFSYYSSPYADKELKANKMFISGGLGYRDKGFFVDLTYVHALEKDANFPYRLPDKANTFANTKTTGSNVMLTVGFKI